MSARPWLTQTKGLLGRIAQGRAATLVRERLLHVSTLGAGFRAAVYGSYAVLALVAVLIALHRKLEHTHRVSIAGISIPAGVIVAGIPVFVIALTLVLTGAMLSNRRLRYSVVVFTALYLLPTGKFARKGFICCDPDEVVRTRPSALLLTLLLECMPLLLLVTAWFYQKLRPSHIALLCLAAVLLPLGTAGLVSVRWNEGFGPSLMLLTWAFFMLAILPALMLVGFDLTEWATLFGGFAGDGVHPRIWPLGFVLAGGAIAVNLALPAFRMHGKHGGTLGIRLALLTVLMVALLAVFALTAEAAHGYHLRHLKLLGMAALTVLGAYFVWMGSTDAPPPVFNYDHDRSFSIIYPQGWKAKLDDDRRDLVSFVASGDKALLAVIGRPRTTGDVYLNDNVPGGDDFPKTKIQYQSAQVDNWDQFETTLHDARLKSDVHFIVWHIDVESSEWFLNTDWYVIGASNARRFEQARPKFEAARRTFTLTPRTVPAPSNRKIVWGIWGTIALLSLGWLLLRRGSPKPALALLLAVTALVLVMNVTGPDLGGEEEIAARTEVLYSAQAVFAAASAVLLFWAWRRGTGIRDRVAQTVLTLNIAFLLAFALSAAYGIGSEAGERSNAIKGIVILLALSWEIASSGELTNHGTRSLPRNSRVLLFMGYALLVAFGVFSFFPTTYRLTTQMAAFDSEQWVIRGILLLGVPFLMVALASRIAPVLWHKERLEPQETQAAVTEQAAAAGSEAQAVPPSQIASGEGVPS